MISETRCPEKSERYLGGLRYAGQAASRFLSRGVLFCLVVPISDTGY
jgi:hypothetical protein